MTVVVEGQEQEPAHRVQRIVQRRMFEMRVALMLYLVVARPPIRMWLLTVILTPLIPRCQRQPIPRDKDVFRSDPGMWSVITGL